LGGVVQLDETHPPLVVELDVLDALDEVVPWTHIPCALQTPPEHVAPTFTEYVQLPLAWQVPGTM
jgi:hypothetical protein